MLNSGKIAWFFSTSGEHKTLFFSQKFYPCFAQDVTIATLMSHSEPKGNEIFSGGESSFYSFWKLWPTIMCLKKQEFLLIREKKN